MIHPDHTTTPILSNVDSVKLSPTEWKIEVQPDSAITDATLERHKYKLAEISRKTFDMFVAGKKSFNYGAVLELDREYRTILETMPDAWIQEHKSLEDKDPYLKSRRFGALQAGEFSFFLEQSQDDMLTDQVDFSPQPYRSLASPFLDERLRSKFQVLLQYRSLYQECQDRSRLPSQQRWLYHQTSLLSLPQRMFLLSIIQRDPKLILLPGEQASIVLAADLFHHIDNGASTAEIESKKEHLMIALEIFGEVTEKKIQSRHLRAIIVQARRILSGLFFEVEKRRARRMARIAQGRGGDPVQEEPFNDVSSPHFPCLNFLNLN